jgi:hypothetical protein
MLNRDERNNYLISFGIALVILVAIATAISTSIPDKPKKYLELEKVINSIDAYNLEINSWHKAKNILMDLNYWYDLLPRYGEIDSTDFELQDLKKKATDRISRLQLKVLPKIREYYGKYLAEKLWLENYKVSVFSLDRNKLIVFAHNDFTDRKLLEKFHHSVLTDLQIIGFSQIRYKWNDTDESINENYLRYNFKEFPDNEIRKFTLAALDF